jgi:hypothetical protein
VPEGKTIALEIGRNFSALTFKEWTNEPGASAGRHAGQTTLASTSEDSQQDFFSLIVSIVAQGELAGSLAGHNLMQTVITKGTCDHLQGTTMFSLPTVDIYSVHQHVESQLATEILDKKGVLISFITAKSMMNMGQEQLDRVDLAQTVEDMAQSYRVRTTRDRHQNTITWLEHLVLN